MRTTIRLDDLLLTEAKQLAARTGRTLTSIIEDALREALARRKNKTGSRRVRLKQANLGRLHGGVSLDHNAELLDLMDGST